MADLRAASQPMRRRAEGPKAPHEHHGSQILGPERKRSAPGRWRRIFRMYCSTTDHYDQPQSICEIWEPLTLPHP